MIANAGCQASESTDQVSSKTSDVAPFREYSVLVFVCRVLVNTLTRHAGDQRLLPLATWLAFDHRIQFLHKPVLTVVPDLRVGLIAHPLLPKHLGEGNLGGLATGRC